MFHRTLISWGSQLDCTAFCCRIRTSSPYTRTKTHKKHANTHSNTLTHTHTHKRIHRIHLCERRDNASFFLRKISPGPGRTAALEEISKFSRNSYRFSNKNYRPQSGITRKGFAAEAESVLQRRSVNSRIFKIDLILILKVREYFPDFGQRTQNKLAPEPMTSNNKSNVHLVISGTFQHRRLVTHNLTEN